MAVEGMNDYTVAQKVDIEASLDEIDTALSAMSAFVGSSDMDPEGDAFSAYMHTWNDQGSFQVSYSSLAALEYALGPGDETLERIMSGESVVSEVRKSEAYSGYFFDVVVPMSKDGRVVGALRSLVEASALVESEQVDSQVALLGSALIKGDETIVAVSSDTERSDKENIYEILAARGVSPEAVKQVRENVENEQDVSTVIVSDPRKDTVFFTSIRLDVNDWNIVNFTRSGDLAEHAQAIFWNTVLTGGALVGISIVVCAAVAAVINRFRRRALREARRYAILAEFSDTVLFEYSYDSDVLELTSNARSIFPLESLAVENYLKNGLPLLDVHEDDYHALTEMLRHPVLDEVQEMLCRVRVLTGEYRWFAFACRYVFDGARAYEAVGKIVDVDVQHKKEEQLEQMSQIDGLTTLYNKVTIEKRIELALSSCEHGTLFVIDVDRFKQVNDVYGHLEGDRVLRVVAQVIRDSFNSYDLVGRVGGDEFVAFARSSARESDIRAYFSSLEKHATEASAELEIEIGLSVGTAHYPQDGTSYQALFDIADETMYRDKSARRG